MLVGNGLIAKVFESYKNSKRVLIFASGVSNSKNTDKLEFDREISLIKSNSHFTGTFVYFSTCSISDPTLQGSPYILHKKKIEKYISETFENFLVVRLPNIIGKTHNKNTLTNFFYDSINSKKHLKIQNNAFRYLIDITDVFLCVNQVLEKNKQLRKVANLVVSKKISVLTILNSFETLLETKASYSIIEGKSDYHIDVDPIFINTYNNTDEYAEKYLRKTLYKYYSTPSRFL